MSWETRNGQRYYYSAERVNGRVTKRYLGKGRFAESLAFLHRYDRGRRLREEADQRQERARCDRLTADLRALSRRLDALVNDTLTAVGYHRHDRGAWRKKRHSMTTTKPAPPFVPDDPDERRRIMRDGLIAASAENPTTAQKALSSQALACLKKHHTDLHIDFLQTIKYAVDYVAGKNEVMGELLRNEIRESREAIIGSAGAKPSGLEELLLDRILCCQLTVAMLERDYFAKMKGDGMSIALSAHKQKCIDAAHKRHLSAIKTLAQVRRLQIPSVNIAMPGASQVNIGDKQVNVDMSVDLTMQAAATAPEPPMENGSGEGTGNAA